MTYPKAELHKQVMPICSKFMTPMSLVFLRSELFSIHCHACDYMHFSKGNNDKVFCKCQPRIRLYQ
jgi:hypothetical protein